MAILVRAAALTNYVEVAQRVGLNPDAQLHRVGLNRSRLKRRDQGLELDATVALLEQSARDAACPTFGLQMAESRKPSDLGAISLLLAHVQSMREALLTLAQFQRMVNPALSLHIEEAGHTVTFHVDVLSKYPGVARQAIELTAGMICRLCAELMKQDWEPLAVHFMHEAPPDTHLHQRVFACPVEFNSDFNGIVWSAARFDQAMPAADAALADYAARLVETMPGAQSGSFVLEVQKSIYQALPGGRASIELIARELGTTVRTLQHHLKQNDVIFSDLVNEAQRDLVMRHIVNPRLSLAQIADLLGFKMAASFTRWFAIQFGMTPSRWRKEKHSGGT